jgi:DNA modification methylase
MGFHLQDARSGLQAITKRVSGDVEWPGLSTTITSPPYYNLKDYGVKGQIGTGQTYSEYVDDLTDIFKLVHSLTSDNGSFWLVCNSFTEDGEVRLLPFDLAGKMKNIGWKLKEVIIWEKDRNLPWSVGRFRNVFEYVLLFGKKQLRFQTDAIREFNINNFRNWWVRYPERYSPDGIAPTDVWKISIPVQGSWRHSRTNHYHLCPFPVELVRRMLLLTTVPGDVVLDPFAGSGVVLATADCMGRPSIGFEIQSQYLKRYRGAIMNDVKSEVERLQETKSDAQNFSSTLIRLRSVKLPRVLARSLKKHRPQRAVVRYVVAIERKPSRNASAYALKGEDIFLVVDRTSRKNMNEVESAAERFLAVPPLSKYGIEARVTVVSSEQIRRILQKHGRQTMWLYDQRSYSYAKRVRVDESLGNLCADFRIVQDTRDPPLLSNVKVDIQLPISMRPERLANTAQE